MGTADCPPLEMEVVSRAGGHFQGRALATVHAASYWEWVIFSSAPRKKETSLQIVYVAVTAKERVYEFK
jgi:hypothetical protein